jgi:ABC-type amino acid transport substrate-binding protein
LGFLDKEVVIKPSKIVPKIRPKETIHNSSLYLVWPFHISDKKKESKAMSNQDKLNRRSFLKTAAASGIAVAGASLLSACGGQAPAVAATSAIVTQTLPQTTVTGDVLNRILKDKAMNVAVVIYPPDVAQVGGQLQGTFIEVSNWIGQQMGVKINFIIAEFGTFIAALQSGRADVAVATTYATVSRSLAVDFTNTIYYLGYSALTRIADVNKWKTIEDADQVGVVFTEREGTPCWQWCHDNLKHATLDSLAAAADPTQMALEVITGRANIYIEDSYLVKKLVAANSTTLAEMPAYADKPWQLNSVAWAVNKGQTSMLSVLNVAIQNLLANNMIQNWQVQNAGAGLYLKDVFYTPS